MISLDELLEKFKLSKDLYHKKGRVSKEISLKRREIVTYLHKQGFTWKEMSKILEKPTSFIQRNTDAMWNPESRKNSTANGVRTGKMWKGQSRGDQLKKQWQDPEYREKVEKALRDPQIKIKIRENQKKSWTKDRKVKHSEMKKRHWEGSEYRKKLMSFHRDPEERKRRSRLQIKRMEENPEKWTRGKGSYVTSEKHTGKKTFWVRSSYEKKAVEILNEKKEVQSFQYEKTFSTNDRYIKPDFIVRYKNGETLLIEVKAGWVLKKSEDSKEKVRLKVAETLAKKQGWAFQIWIEKDLFHE